MAATLRNLLSQIKSGRVHFGFGQEPVPPKSTRPKNIKLVRKLLDHYHLPEDDQKTKPDE